MRNFTRIRRKTKKLWLSISPSRRPSDKPGLRQPEKRCELPLFFAALPQAVHRWKALDLGSSNMQFQQDWPKDKKITALSIFWLKTEKIRSTERLLCAPRGIDNFSLAQLQEPYSVG